MDDFKQPKIRSFRDQNDPADYSPEPEPSTEPILNSEPEFVPPDQIPQDDIETIDLDMDIDEKKSKRGASILAKGSKRRLNLTKKQKIIIAISAIAILLIAFLVWWFLIKSEKPVNTYKPAAVVKKEAVHKIISPLTGAEVSSAALANRPVTGLMIENSQDARPQSGLNEAGIVVEAVAEGGITRFLALFQEATPQYIGPVRSARPYYLDYALAFDASFGHVGGSPDALNDIKNLGVKDLDQFFNAGAYWRTSDRAAPHNVYTSFEKLDALNTSKSYTSSKFTPLQRKKDVPQTPVASSIDFSVSGPLYNPHFQYDAATNTYKRSEGGEAHTDLRSGAQLSPKVVIALVMSKGTSDGYHSSYADTGSGKAYVFQDGVVSEGTWSKPDRKGSLTLTDKNGLPLKLNAGQTWITLVGSPSDVVYKP